MAANLEASTFTTRLWWEREDLTYRAGRLLLGSHDVAHLAEAFGTPLFLYHAARVRQNLVRLQNALDRHYISHRIFFAVKANHFPPLLTLLRHFGGCGADCCSPNELLLCRQVGFAPRDLSYTGTSISDEDVTCLSRHPGVWVNCDSLAAIRRLGRKCPGRTIGIRINPQTGIGYSSNPLVRYAGPRATKLGIYASEFPTALRLAKQKGLRVAGLHVHAGSGYLNPQLETFEQILKAVASFARKIRGLSCINLGGGLGVPLTKTDSPLDLDAWAGLVARHLESTGIPIWIEPGDYLVKDAGVLVLQINSVERKGKTTFIGVNGGFNLHPEPAFYRLPLEIVPCAIPVDPGPGRRRRHGKTRRVTVAGNINEAHDLFAEGVNLPTMQEGEFLAFLNAGAYGSSMVSNHCLRGELREVLLSDPELFPRLDVSQPV